MATPDYAQVELDGMRFKVLGAVNVGAVDRFPPKLTVGDYSIDSNDLLSAWVISDSTGGHGVAELREGVDDNRYRFSRVYTRYPKQYTLPFATYRQAAAEQFPLGDMYYAGVGTYEYYAVRIGSMLYRDDVNTGLTVTGQPTDTAVAFAGTAATKLLYIPQGTNGYTTYNRGAGTLTNNLGDLMKAFVLWDNKIVAIDVNGQLYYATTAAATTSWTSYGSGGKLDSDFIPYKLHVYPNQAGNPTVYVVTDQAVWAFDPDSPRLYRIPNLESVHPRFGYASEVWRSNFYVAAGMDLLEFNGNVIRNIGLSRDDGLPWLHQGYIVALAAGQNALYAMVAAGGLDAAGTLSSNVLDIHEWSEYGWHCTSSIDTGSGRAFRSLAVSRALGTYRLRFGAGFGAWYQALPETFANPREDIANLGGFKYGYIGSSPAAYNYAFESGRFDANMEGYQKIANAVQVHVRSIGATQTVVVKYRVNADTAYSTLGTVTAAGFTTLQFGAPDAYGVYPGLPFYAIEFRMELTGTAADEGTTQVVESLVFSFLKLQNPSLSWPMQIDLSGPFQGNSPDQMRTKLTALRTANRFFALKHLGQTYRVRIAGMSGTEEPGKDTRGQVTLNVLEIPTMLGVA